MKIGRSSDDGPRLAFEVLHNDIIVLESETRGKGPQERLSCWKIRDSSLVKVDGVLPELRKGEKFY